MALKTEIQTYQILTNDDEVCIPSLSSILLAVSKTQSSQNASVHTRVIYLFGRKKRIFCKVLLFLKRPITLTFSPHL